MSFLHDERVSLARSKVPTECVVSPQKFWLYCSLPPIPIHRPDAWMEMTEQWVDFSPTYPLVDFSTNIRKRLLFQTYSLVDFFHKHTVG